MNSTPIEIADQVKAEVLLDFTTTDKEAANEFHSGEHIQNREEKHNQLLLNPFSKKLVIVDEDSSSYSSDSDMEIYDQPKASIPMNIPEDANLYDPNESLNSGEHLNPLRLQAFYNNENPFSLVLNENVNNVLQMIQDSDSDSEGTIDFNDFEELSPSEIKDVEEIADSVAN